MENQFKVIVPHNILMLTTILRDCDIDDVNYCLKNVLDTYYVQVTTSQIYNIDDELKNKFQKSIVSHILECVDKLDSEIVSNRDEFSKNMYYQLRDCISEIQHYNDVCN